MSSSKHPWPDSETNMESLLSSPIWPLGSVFLSLFDYRRSACTSLRSINSQLKPVHNTPTRDLDGSPIPAQELPRREHEEDRNLPHSHRSSPYQKPALSYRLTSPASIFNQKNSFHPSHRAPGHSEHFFPSSPNYARQSDHPSTLWGRLEPVPDGFPTSSNRIECRARNWGPTTHKPRPNLSTHYYRPDFPHPHKRPSFSDKTTHPSSPASYSQATTNRPFYREKPRPSERWKRSNEDDFEDDGHHKKKNNRNHPMDWDWNHWDKAEGPRSENRPPTTKAVSPRSNASVKNRSPSLSTSVDVSVTAAERGKKEGQIGFDKKKYFKPSHRSHGSQDYSGNYRKKPRTSFDSDHHHYQIGPRTARSISPSLPSPRAGSVPDRLPNETDPHYYRLNKLHPALKDSINRAVYSWINQALVASFWKVGIWFEDAKKWKSDQWGSLRVDQFETIVDLTLPKGLESLFRPCKTDRFLDLFVKPVHCGIFVLAKDSQTNADYVKLTKDYTPIGLLYRPIIKGLRKYRASAGVNRIQVDLFVRNFLIKISDEEDLIYLFQKDDDPYGCMKRALRDGIIEISEGDDYGQTSSSLQLTNSTEFLDRHQPHPSGYGKNKRKRVEFERQYIGLKEHWLSNTEVSDHPSIYSPTISQGGSSSVLPTEEDPNPGANGSTREAEKPEEALGKIEEEASASRAGDRAGLDAGAMDALDRSNDARDQELGSGPPKRGKMRSWSKTSSTNTDETDPKSSAELLLANQLPPASQQSLFGKPTTSPAAGSFLTEDQATVESIILQLKKDVYSS